MQSCQSENSPPDGNCGRVEDVQFCSEGETHSKPNYYGQNDANSEISSQTAQNLSMKSDEKQKNEKRGRKMTLVNFLPSDCKLCGANFTSDKALGYHIRDVHVIGKKDDKKVRSWQVLGLIYHV